MQAEVMNKALNKPGLKEVKATAHDGVVTLAGTVPLFDLKQEADKRTHKIKGVQSVTNEIEVAGPNLPDSALEAKLVKAISYDRVGYGTTPFNAISVQVQGGTATLSGHAYGPVDASSALALAAHTPGVKNVVNQVRVDPLSPMDDRSSNTFNLLTTYCYVDQGINLGTGWDDGYGGVSLNWQPATTQAADLRAVRAYYGPNTVHVHAGIVNALESWRRIVRVNGWMIALGVLFALAGAFLARDRSTRHGLILLLGSALALLVGSVLVSSYLYRYAIPPAALLMLAGSRGVEVTVTRYRRPRSETTERRTLVERA